MTNPLLPLLSLYYTKHAFLKTILLSASPTYNSSVKHPIISPVQCKKYCEAQGWGVLSLLSGYWSFLCAPLCWWKWAWYLAQLKRFLNGCGWLGRIVGGTELCSKFIAISMLLMMTVSEFTLTVYFCCKPILDYLRSSASLTGCEISSKQRDLPVILKTFLHNIVSALFCCFKWLPVDNEKNLLKNNTIHNTIQ